MTDLQSARAVVVKLVLFSYVIPGIIIYYIFKSLHAPWNSVLAFMFAYLMLTSIINICILKRTFQETDVPDLENNSETPTPDPKDEPPSYVEVNEQPPPYSLLKYYKRIMKKSPFIRRNNSLEKSRTSQALSTEPSASCSRPSLKRNQSSPN